MALTSDDDKRFEVSDEERRANVLKLRRVQWDIRNDVQKPKKLVWKHYHDPKALLAALDTFKGEDDA